ncbi:MAG: hypothetical protein ACRCZP_19755 [Phycicoccus sp.]
MIEEARQDSVGALMDAATLATVKHRQLAARLREMGLDHEAAELDDIRKVLASRVTACMSPTARIHLEDTP